MEKTTIWDSLNKTPAEAKKTISAGRLKGFTDINPMWRLRRLTEIFGSCGVGWKLEIKKYWTECGSGNEVRAFMEINLYYRTEDGKWSEPVPGLGGASFVAQEKNGAYTSDECYKMAFTDAIGSACKLLGMSEDVYFAQGASKYSQPTEQQPAPPMQKPKPTAQKCDCCGKEIVEQRFANGAKRTPQQIIDFSAKQFGQKLCFVCTKARLNDIDQKNKEEANA